MLKKPFLSQILILGLVLNPAFQVQAQSPQVSGEPVKPAPVAAPKGSVVGDTSVTGNVNALESKSATPVVLSFLEWKSLRVHEAQQKLEQISKGQSNTNQVWQEGKTTNEEVVGKPSEQKLNFNVDVALQLNIQDYFSMYLKTLSLEEFKEATKRLTAEETTELLIAYKNTMDKDKKIPLKFSKIPKDNAKSKNPEL